MFAALELVNLVLDSVLGFIVTGLPGSDFGDQGSVGGCGLFDGGDFLYGLGHRAGLHDCDWILLHDFCSQFCLETTNTDLGCHEVNHSLGPEIDCLGYCIVFDSVH